MARMKRILRFRFEWGIGNGKGVHMTMARVKARVGARINKT